MSFPYSTSSDPTFSTRFVPRAVAPGYERYTECVTDDHHHHIGKYFAILVVLLVISALWYAFGGRGTAQEIADTEVPLSGFPKDTPAPSPVDMTTAQSGFQYLVSMTDAGFRPTEITVHAGETVRFTNNASATVVISTDGMSSPSLVHGAYWEHTFNAKGVTSFNDGAGHAGSVIVK